MNRQSDQSNRSKADRCTHPSLRERGEVHLPVLLEHSPKGHIRKSKNGPRRAIVLATVQLLMLAHIAMWLLSQKYGWFGGKTLTPVEPSESMMFSKNGVINAGLIFFSVALLSTLIFGRWFCGWGCHIVMLQDFCGWIMKKCGVRPRLFRSRFLVYVPLILAVYMFILPAVHRWWLIPLDANLAAKWGADHWFVTSMRTAGDWTGFPLGVQLDSWKVSSHLTTTKFWDTFPGGYSAWFVIPVFLFVCGFAMVYFLGAKGFCTYGCPYGGFFYPLDRFAVGKIRVTDACEHCGHCTAVCTSNVRVHEEVREYGMVVDPGCMKCMDCVSVCPNEALYFGFGAPSVLKGPAKSTKPKKIYDMTLLEESAAALLFVFIFVAVRGAYGLVPMLMAAGVAGIVTFLAWKSWRLMRDSSVTLHKFQLKLKGSVRPTGWLLAVVTALLIVVIADFGAVTLAMTLAQRNAARVTMSPDVVFSQNPMQMSQQMTADADRALAWYRRASFVTDGGWGILPIGRADLDMAIAGMLSTKLQFEDAERVLRRSIEQNGMSDVLCKSLMWVLHAEFRDEEALALAEQQLMEHAGYPITAETYLGICGMKDQADRSVEFSRRRMEKFPDDDQAANVYSIALSTAGRPEENLAMWRQRVERRPDSLFSMRMLSLALLDAEQFAESEQWILRTLKIEPHHANAYYFLAVAQGQQHRMDEAIESLRNGLKIEPENLMLNQAMAGALSSVGRNEEAQSYLNKVQSLQRNRPHAP